MSTEQDSSDFRELCDAVFDDRATHEQVRQLEELVLSSPDLKRLYVELVHQHASLSWSVVEGEPLDAPPEPVGDASSIPIVGLNAAGQPPQTSQRLYWPLGAIAMAAAVIIALLTPIFWGEGSDESVASIANAKNCLWRATDLPTANGSRLVPGRMTLVEGLATIRFDHGVDVNVEAPADFEIVATDRIWLHSGRLVATAKPGAEGFTVRTPTAELIDKGTEFGVAVGNDGVSDVVVFDGLVEAKPDVTGDSRLLETGERIRITSVNVTSLDEGDDRIAGQVRHSAPSENITIQISTADGRGQDAYIQRHLFADALHRSATLLLLKNSFGERTAQDRMAQERYEKGFDRKAYLRFDLSLIHDHEVKAVELALHFAPTGFGFASRLPDATFAVYGLADDQLDDWAERDLNWANAPGNNEGNAEVRDEVAVLLGRFVVPQGQASGVFGVRGQPLRDLIQSDTNGLLTMVVVRETASVRVGSLVHGFASHRHPELPPPTLRVITKGKTR
jgi:hypothetical protein